MKFQLEFSRKLGKFIKIPRKFRGKYTEKPAGIFEKNKVIFKISMEIPRKIDGNSAETPEMLDENIEIKKIARNYAETSNRNFRRK